MAGRRRQSVSVPGRGPQEAGRRPGGGQEAARRQSREPRRQVAGSLASLDTRPRQPGHQRTRTISVPVGLKEILNELSKEVIFAQPRNIPLYCAQLLEGRLQERLVQEQAERREEQEVEVAREEFRRQQRQARASQQKKHSESQTGFTTDSDSGFESRCIEKGKRFHKTTRTIDTGTEEDSMDSPSNDTDCLSPKQTLGLIEEEKRPKDTGHEEDKPAQASLRAAPVAEVAKVAEVTEVAEMASPRKPPSRRRLASVSESLDRAMEELELGLGGARAPDPAQPQQPSSLLLPTSDFEEESRSEESEAEDRDKEDVRQLVTVSLDTGAGQVVRVHLLVTGQGVAKVSQEEADNCQLAARTTLPIVLGLQPTPQPPKLQEKKAEIENINKTVCSPRCDLAAAGQDVEAAQPQQTINNNQASVRSLSPVFCPRPSSQSRPAHQIQRQRTFVETSSSLAQRSTAVGPDTAEAELADTSVQTEREVGSEAASQTEDAAARAAAGGCSSGTQTICVAVSQAATNTAPAPAPAQLISDPLPAAAARTPRYELSFGATQTSPRATAAMTSQTSPPATSRTRESSPSSTLTASQPRPPAALTEEAADEMVCRVLLEHAGEAEDSSSSRVSSSSSSTVPDSDRSASFLSAGSGRATSYDAHKKGMKDLSRTVNYLDLSRLGNEGETPNSDEIWVTVEDDNKFLTSDTETYSVATDKVSTMATFKGHAVGSGFAENIALLNSASETELAELGNESLASDLEGQDFSLQNFGNLLHHEMEPIRTRLDSTGRTVAGIAETLYHIQDGINNLCCNVTQMKSKVLSSVESENTMFVAGIETGSEVGEAAEKGEAEKLELVRDGVPVGEPELLVERMMRKLDSALRRRDENIRNVVLSLEEDNKQLRQELEHYRAREAGAEQQSAQLETKIQLVLDSVEKLSQQPHPAPAKSPRSDHSGKEPASSSVSDSRHPRHKRRSKSRPKNTDHLDQEASTSDETPKEQGGVKLKPKRQTAFENDTATTSSDSDSPQQGKANKNKTSKTQVDKLQVIVTSTQSENVALKQDLVEQKEKEAELVKRNLELEAQLVQAMTPSEELPQEEPQKKVELATREVQTSAAASGRQCSSAAVNTEDTGPPVTRVVSPSSSSPSKSESPVKDDSSLAAKKQQVRKSRARVKVTSKAGSSGGGEVTEVGEVHGRGAGVDGGTPSPSPSRDKVKTEKVEKEEKVVSPPKPEVKANGTGNNGGNGNGKKQQSRSVSKPNGKKVTSVPKVTEPKKELNGKKGSDVDKKPKEDPKKKTVGGPGPKKNTGDGDKKSKVIEGDDFRVTITSNTDLVSCEYSDREDVGSPRKKIIVTPKTPDSKKAEKQQVQAAAKQEVVKKGGKIPIREMYIKQKAELPAPQQYPAARPGRDQLPHPVAKSIASSCAASPGPSFSSPLALSLNQPMTVNYVGYNTCVPPTPLPASDHALLCSPSDRSIASIASTNLPFSGRNTVMSCEGEGSVFTMMIKQESRDSNVYDAPSHIPDIYTRESPDGAYSYVIDGPAVSSMSNISDLKQDVEEESSDGFEKDIIRDFVMLEESEKKYSLDRRKGGAPFKGYAEKVKQKVIQEYVKHESFPIKNNKVDFSEKDRPPTRVLPVRKPAARRFLKSRTQSLSVDQLHEVGRDEAGAGAGSRRQPGAGPEPRMTRSRNTYYSTERLPTLTASEEERIIRLKKYEDDTEKLNEKRAAALRVREAKEKYKCRKQKSFHHPHNDVTIYETNRPWTVPDELTIEDNADCVPEDNDNNYEVNANNANYDDSTANFKQKQLVNNGEGLQNGVEASEDDQNNNNNNLQTEEGSGSLSQKRRKLKKWRGLSPMTKTNNKVVGFNQLPLSVECFIVGRGWQVDQAQLNKAISKLDGINFVRIQMANTINRVVENIRPHNDVVLIHIGTNELSEACHSISNEDSVAGLAGSMASVFSRHIITACRTFRETKLVVSVPIPRNTAGQDARAAHAQDSLQFYDPLRKAFTNCLRANFIDYDNVIICSNDNLATDSGQPDSKFYTDSVNLNNAGMKKLTRNWEAIIQRMRRISEGVIHYRRSSESSSITSSNSSAGSSSSSSSIVHRNPWKPY